MQCIDKTAILPDKVLKICNTYKKSVPLFVQKLISMSETEMFLDGEKFCRFMAFDEIICAREELHVDFSRYGIIPFFDTGDNDFIVYDCENNIWKIFNIVDKISFLEKNTLNEFLQ